MVITVAITLLGHLGSVSQFFRGGYRAELRKPYQGAVSKLGFVCINYKKLLFQTDTTIT